MPKRGGHPLDSCARLHLDRRGRVRSYFGCGLLGVMAGTVLVGVLAGLVPVSATTAVTAVIAPQISFLLAVKVAQMVAGYERIVMYEMALAALAGTAAGLRLAGEQIGPGLDLTATGIMAFLAVARIGCLRVGCCHGRPHRSGISYSPAHAAAGFPSYLVGVRLFPIQLVESGAAVLLAAAGAAVTLRPHAPGEVACLVLALYGPLRFGFEVARGDAVRPRTLGLSEAQWLAWGLSLVCAALAHRGGWTSQRLCVGAAGLVTAASLVLVALARGRLPGAKVLSAPWQLAELALALAQLRAGGPTASALNTGIVVVQTRGGLRLSGAPDGPHLTLSGPGLDHRGADQVSRQIGLLGGRPAPLVRPGQAEGVFHLIYPAE